MSTHGVCLPTFTAPVFSLVPPTHTLDLMLLALDEVVHCALAGEQVVEGLRLGDNQGNLRGDQGREGGEERGHNRPAGFRKWRGGEGTRNVSKIHEVGRRGHET